MYDKLIQEIEIFKKVIDDLREKNPQSYLIFDYGKNGDTFISLLLINSFKKVHIKDTDKKITFIVAHKVKQNIAMLFVETLDHIILDERMQQVSYKAIRLWQALEGYRFEIGWPIFNHYACYMLYPDWHLMGEKSLTFLELTALGFEIPISDIAPFVPKLSQFINDQGEKFCIDNQIKYKHSLILFPYAQSIKVNALKHFQALAEEMLKRGFSVFTSISGDEQEIPGTQGIFIPFELLQYVASYAGMVISVRSGICDMLVTSNAKKIILYTDPRAIECWTVESLKFSMENTKEIICNYFPGTESDFVNQSVSYLT